MLNKSICVIEELPKDSGRYECYEDLPAKVCVHKSQAEFKTLKTFNTSYKNCQDWCSSTYSWWTEQAQPNHNELDSEKEHCIIINSNDS